MGDLQQASPIPTNIPKGIVTEWGVDDVRNWLSTSMQLPQYLEQFEENEIAGDVLVHLDHDALKDLDVSSVGHRLYLLKQIYNLKIAHGIKFEKDDYVPISAPKGDEEDEVPPANILKHLRDRDSKIQILEYEVKRMNDQVYRLKEELVPVFKAVREKPLPTPDLPAIATPTTSGSSLARKFSTKKLFLGGSRKPVEDSRQMEISKPLMSPTYLNGINDERRPESPRSPTKSVIPITPGLQLPTPYGSSYTPSPEVTSAQGSAFSNTTPLNTYAPYTTSPVTPRRERKEDEMDTVTPRNRSNSATEKDTEKETQVTTSRSDNRPRPSREGRSKDGFTNPMKSFRVNMDDPCWKVLPAAMKKYDVKGREEDYRLYITYGDIERKLSLNEKPLIIFQQLQKEGRNPLFMLRYAGKSRPEQESRDRDRDRDHHDREHRSGRNAPSKDEDPTTPKLGSANGDGHGRYGEGGKTSAGNGMF